MLTEPHKEIKYDAIIIMKNIEKNNKQYKLGLYNRYGRHQTAFIDVLKKLINTLPNDAKDKLSSDAPLGKLINAINFKDFLD